MDKLQNARQTINEVDREMAKLFVRRMDAVRTVAEYKAQMGLPVLDAAREAAVVERNSALVSDEELRSYYVSFIKSNMEISRSYQHRLLEGMKIAYCGVEGAFAHIAACKIFPDGVAVSYDSFGSAYAAVADGECDCAVLPIENSYAGEVGQVTDIMFNGSLHINGMYDLKITQNLLGLPGTDISDIRTVISHPQALSQCAQYIKDHHFESVQASNTAAAAQELTNIGDKSIAAIASAETAAIYGLEIIDHDINESGTNTTRFAVFSRSEKKSKASDNVFVLMFTVSNVAGALAKAIGIIGKHGFNMRVLRSRPIKDENWKYYFYVEAEGDSNSDNARIMLDELAGCCDKLKVVGNYTNATLDGGDKE